MLQSVSIFIGGIIATISQIIFGKMLLKENVKESKTKIIITIFAITLI